MRMRTGGADGAAAAFSDHDVGNDWPYDIDTVVFYAVDFGKRNRDFEFDFKR